MVATSDVFTPAKLPTITDVDRSAVSSSLRQWARRGGFFVTVLGTTKLGKTTLVKNYLNSLDPDRSWSTYLSGQSLQSGPVDLWRQLARELEIPTSRETGMASSDRTTWGVFGRLSASWFPGNGVSAGAKVGGELANETSSGEKFDVDPEAAVKSAILELLEAKVPVVVAIDDFHFVQSVDTRRDIVLALRPLTDNGLTVVLSTIHAGQVEEAMTQTNLGGRRKRVVVPKWSEAELAQIANKGFAHLSVTTTEDVVARLASESFGSPQIMQQHCLDLCENVNGVVEGESDLPLQELREPDDWAKFFRALEDDDAAEWLRSLTRGPNPRKPRKKHLHPGPPPRALDGYQLIMLALHELGAPTEVPFAEVKQHIGRQLRLSATELNKLALELKAKNQNALASKDTRAALNAHSTAALEISSKIEAEDEADEDAASLAELTVADAIPQPVYEVRGEQQQAEVRVLDPLLSYVLRWHSDLIFESGR